MCVRMCPLTVEEAQAVLDARATPGGARNPLHRAPRPPARRPPGQHRARLRPRGRWPRRRAPHVGFPARRQAQRRLQHAHRVRPRAAAPGQTRHVGQGHSGGPLPRPRARLLRGTHDRKGSRARGPAGPYAASTCSASPAPGRSCSPPCARATGSRSSPPGPNASVAPIHDRMPLVLGPGESNVWLGPDFAELANRSALVLASDPEC